MSFSSADPRTNARKQLTMAQPDPREKAEKYMESHKITKLFKVSAQHPISQRSGLN